MVLDKESSVGCPTNHFLGMVVGKMQEVLYKTKKPIKWVVDCIYEHKAKESLVLIRV